MPAPALVSLSEIECEEILATLAGERSVDLADYDLSDPTSPRVAPLTLFASTFTYRDALAAVARAFDASPSPGGTAHHGSSWTATACCG